MTRIAFEHTLHMARSAVIERFFWDMQLVTLPALDVIVMTRRWWQMWIDILAVRGLKLCAVGCEFGKMCIGPMTLEAIVIRVLALCNGTASLADAGMILLQV